MCPKIICFRTDTYFCTTNLKVLINKRELNTINSVLSSFRLSILWFIPNIIIIINFNFSKYYFISISAFNRTVAGMFIFAVVFGFVALILSICGVCTLTLPKKIYYYHSSGEIYLICGKYPCYNNIFRAVSQFAVAAI